MLGAYVWKKVLGRVSLHIGALLGNLGRGGRTDVLIKAVEWAPVSIGAPLLGNMEGHSSLRAFEIKRYIMRYVKMPCKRYRSHRGPVGENGGDTLEGTF
jgi:hypothetical protein